MPKGAHSVRFSFDEHRITHFGGMWLVRDFTKKIQLGWLLQKYVRLSRKHPLYQPSEIILALMFVIIMGLRRINKSDILRYNGAFLDMLGLDRFPDQSTLRRFLKSLPPSAIRQIARLHDSLRAHLFVLPNMRRSLIFDVDSTVLVVYGNQGGARVGYNPKKPGRRSYHPLLCFEAKFHEFWHGSMRPGNAATVTGAIPFLKVCLAKVPPGIPRSQIRFRMDSGFYGSPVIRFLDRSKCRYVIVARPYPNLVRRAQGCRFHRFNNGWEVSEFRDLVHHKDRRTHRFVVVRRPIPDDPEEAKQLTLFRDRRYSYHLFVTNLKLKPWEVYLFYCPRAHIEKNIRELIYDYPLAKIPSDSWTANVAYFQLILFAADVIHWFRRLCLPPEYLTATLDTIRSDFIVLPARLVRIGSKNVVKLPHDYHYRKQFLSAAAKIKRFRFPPGFRICQ